VLTDRDLEAGWRAEPEEQAAAAFGEMMARWLATATPQPAFRETLLNLHLETIRKILPTLSAEEASQSGDEAMRGPTSLDERSRRQVEILMPIVAREEHRAQAHVLSDLVATWLTTIPQRAARKVALTLHVMTVRELLPRRVAELERSSARLQASEAVHHVR
jgi:hypothetical protein